MSQSPNLGLFTWYELLTHDADAATAFYGEVVGWKAQAWPDPSMKYTLWTMADGTAVGGLMTLADAQQPDGRPHWSGVVSVADADATAARATELGGAVLSPPMDIPNVGRFALIADPTGATFSIMQSSDPSGPIDGSVPGRVSWHELWTSDPAAAWAFYQGLFGWVDAGTMEMGPGRTYQMFGRTKDEAHGGIAAKDPNGPPSAWLFYATVPNADAAAERAKTQGATIFMGPMDVPGGGRCAGGMDKQGAGFAVVSY